MGYSYLIFLEKMQIMSSYLIGFFLSQLYFITE